jgi:hypothetical protein
LAYKKARKGKTKKPDIIEFEKDLWKNDLNKFLEVYKKELEYYNDEMNKQIKCT